MRRLRSFDSASLADWTHDGLWYFEVLRQPDDYRGQLVRLQGRVRKLRVTNYRPRTPSAWRCPSITSARSCSTPIAAVEDTYHPRSQSLAESKTLDEPASASALYLKLLGNGELSPRRLANERSCLASDKSLDWMVNCSGDVVDLFGKRATRRFGNLRARQSWRRRRFVGQHSTPRQDSRRRTRGRFIRSCRRLGNSLQAFMRVDSDNSGDASQLGKSEACRRERIRVSAWHKQGAAVPPKGGTASLRSSTNRKPDGPFDRSRGQGTARCARGSWREAEAAARATWPAASESITTTKWKCSPTTRRIIRSCFAFANCRRTFRRTVTLDVPVHVAGFFFKDWLYRTRHSGDATGWQRHRVTLGQPQYAPLLIGARTDGAGSRRSKGNGGTGQLVGGVLFVLALAGIWGVARWFARGDRRFRAADSGRELLAAARANRSTISDVPRRRSRSNGFRFQVSSRNSGD